MRSSSQAEPKIELEENDLNECIQPIMYSLAPTRQGVFYRIAWTSKQNPGIVRLRGHQSGKYRDPTSGRSVMSEMREAKAPSIERRLERFLSNEKIQTEETWEQLLRQVMPYFRKGPIQVVVDLTSYEEHAQVISPGLLQHSRVLPLVWKVMPGQDKWDQGLWESIEELFKRLAPHLGETDCTVMGDSAFG